MPLVGTGYSTVFLLRPGGSGGQACENLFIRNPQSKIPLSVAASPHRRSGKQFPLELIIAVDDPPNVCSLRPIFPRIEASFKPGNNHIAERRVRSRQSATDVEHYLRRDLRWW